MGQEGVKVMKGGNSVRGVDQRKRGRGGGGGGNHQICDIGRKRAGRLKDALSQTE